MQVGALSRAHSSCSSPTGLRTPVRGQFEPQDFNSSCSKVDKVSMLFPPCSCNRALLGYLGRLQDLILSPYYKISHIWNMNHICSHKSTAISQSNTTTLKYTIKIHFNQIDNGNGFYKGLLVVVVFNPNLKNPN